MLTAAVAGLLLLVPAILFQSGLLPADVSNLLWFFNAKHSFDVSRCPGYTLDSLAKTYSGLTAQLRLSGKPCNAFGQDIVNLTIEVTYETDTRLHVNIFDTDKQQFTIPESVIKRPAKPSESYIESSDIEFNYDASPFAFWITRRSEPHAAPLFDTRLASMPGSNQSSTLFPLIFEDRYLQMVSVLPLDANIYGLGEVVSSSGFRRAVGTRGDNGTIQTMWARDAADPLDENVYGSHPMYLEHRFDDKTNKSQSHGVFLFSSAGADILLSTPPAVNSSLIEYRLLGGTLDLYFFAGPNPQNVIEQYGAVVGLPGWQPAWAFGFHLCRWGYHDVNETREQVRKMREANIPLEVIWNDIDLYHDVRDFTTDPINFPGDEMRAFIHELKSNHQQFIPIVDAAIAHQANASDIYDPFTRGIEKSVFIINPDGKEHIGQVWPGFTVFPDWFANNTQAWWTEALTNWSERGVEFSGIWLDMNEASSFCDGSCGTGANLSDSTLPFLLPGAPGNPISSYPECYNSTISGPSGNMTVNGTTTYTCGDDGFQATVTKREFTVESGIDLHEPPYAIHNGNGKLSARGLASNAVHAGGYTELDVHNLWGLMSEMATHSGIQKILPGKRPFMISRATFPSSGRYTGHWLGDNFSLWQYMHYDIQGILQFQLFQIPFVGADTCGFIGNTNEELCNRWMQLSAFVPFYRNHNIKAAIGQEPYRWDSVASASRSAMAIRYALLPYWYTLFANASTLGTPPVRALFFEFPDEPELFSIDRQFLVGRNILVTPVLTPGASAVEGIFPGRNRVIWRDWHTHEVVDTKPGAYTTLAAPLGHINVHIRDGSAILLHAQPAYTVEETRRGPFSLLVFQSFDGHAFGTAFLDDGISSPPGPSKTLTFISSSGRLQIQARGPFDVAQKLQEITVLGVASKPAQVILQGRKINSWVYTGATQKLVVNEINEDLNGPVSLVWI